MKFSTLEQDVIKNLCRWAEKPDVFKATHTFISAFGLKYGTGIFTFSKDIENRPHTIFCIDIKKINVDDYELVCNNALFILFFLRKLESLGLVTISEKRYSKEKEYALAVFNNNITIQHFSKTQIDTEYICKFDYIKDSGVSINAGLVRNGLSIKDLNTGECLPYNNQELFCRFETFDLISSTIAVGQELFELRENGFKTYEELALEKANVQFDVSKSILEEAKKQTKAALNNISQAKEQFNKAQEDAKDQFNEAQKESKNQYDSANKNSKRALGLAVASIIISSILSIFMPTTITKKQFNRVDSVETATLKQIEDINTRAATQDSTFIYLGDRLDSISSTLQTINEKCNNKRPPQKNTH